jgi:hypothetical protein
MKLFTPFIIGLSLGLLLYHFLFRPDISETVEETIRTETNTVYVPVYQTLEMPVDSIKTLNDSIDYYQRLYKQELGNIKIVHDSVFIDKPFSAPLRRFTGDKVHLYGTTRYNALVAGSLLDMAITNDFSIPEITNTIYRDRKVTKTTTPRGSLWAGGMVSANRFELAPTVAYQKNGWQLNYKYELNREMHWAGVSFRVFGK